MHIEWDDAKLFLAVVDHGSTSAAARALRIAQPTVSRRLAALEDALGFALFDRSTAGTTLTSRGESLVEPAKKMAEWAAELERAAEAKEREPSGVVRVTAPPGIAFDFVAGFAAFAKKKLPKISLQVLSSIEYLDLVRGEADLALRFRKPEQRDLVVVATVVDEIGLFASPKYVDKVPKKPKLHELAFIGWAPPYDRLSPNPELAALMPGWKPSFAADDFLVQLRACEEGLGVMFLGKSRHPFSRLKLVEVPFTLPPQMRTTELHLVAAKRALDVPRIRSVAHLLVDELAHLTR